MEGRVIQDKAQTQDFGMLHKDEDVNESYTMLLSFDITSSQPFFYLLNKNPPPPPFSVQLRTSTWLVILLVLLIHQKSNL